jgi:hypothetical protein
MNEAFVTYMLAEVLQLELNQLHVFEWSQIGRAQLQLAEVLAAVRSYKALQTSRQTRNLKIHGPNGTELGTLTVSSSILTALGRPLHADPQCIQRLTILASCLVQQCWETWVETL